MAHSTNTLKILSLEHAMEIGHVVERHLNHVPALGELHDNGVAVLLHQPAVATGVLAAQHYQRSLRLLRDDRFQLVLVQALHSGQCVSLRSGRYSEIRAFSQKPSAKRPDFRALV